MPTGSTATARPSAIGPLDGPRGWAGLDALDDAEGEELGGLDALGEARPEGDAGRSMGPEGGAGLDALDALGRAGPLIPVGGELDRLDASRLDDHRDPPRPTTQRIFAG